MHAHCPLSPFHEFLKKFLSLFVCLFVCLFVYYVVVKMVTAFPIRLIL